MSFHEFHDWCLPEEVVPADMRPDAILLGVGVHAQLTQLASVQGRELAELSRWPGVPMLRANPDTVPPFVCVRVWDLVESLGFPEALDYFDQEDPAFQELTRA